jgi:hypothetical protein
MESLSHWAEILQQSVLTENIACTLLFQAELAGIREGFVDMK